MALHPPPCVCVCVSALPKYKYFAKVHMCRSEIRELRIDSLLPPYETGDTTQICRSVTGEFRALLSGIDGRKDASETNTVTTQEVWPILYTTYT